MLLSSCAKVAAFRSCRPTTLAGHVDFSCEVDVHALGLSVFRAVTSVHYYYSII